MNHLLLIPAAFILFFFIFLALCLAVFIFWLVMLVNAIQRKFSGNEKLLWVLVIIFAGIIGAIIYYFLVYRKKK